MEQNLSGDPGDTVLGSFEFRDLKRGYNRSVQFSFIDDQVQL